MTEPTQDALTIVGPEGRFPKVTLIEPDARGYFFCGLTIDLRPPFLYWLQSPAKRRALAQLTALAADLRRRGDVAEANVFRALLRPPGRGAYLATRPEIPAAAYDLVLLVAFDSPASARAYAASPEWRAVEAALPPARDRLVQCYSNERRIGPVDHSRQGVFLFNYFVAADRSQNLAVWRYTAGWFQDQTGLDNSTLLVPQTEAGPTIVNHCRWDRLRDILPALIFKPSFRRFVLANFAANRTAAQPVLYRLVPASG